MSNPLSFYANPVPARGYANFGATPVFECSKTIPSEGPKTVPVTLAWNDYKNIAGTASPLSPVSINLQGGNTGSAISQVRSVKIDNLQCPTPVTIFFPDTGDEIVCAALSTTRCNVLTGGFQCIVYMSIQTSNLGKQTTIFFNNFQVDTGDIEDTTATFNYWWATGAPFSLNFTRPRTLGDQWNRYSVNLALTGAASQVPIFFGPPDGYNFIILSEIHVRTLGCYVAQAALTKMNMSFIDSVGSSPKNFSWYALNDISEFSGEREVVTVVDQQSIFSSFIGPATYRKWFLQNNVAGNGTAEVDLVYTLVNVTNF